MKVESILYGMQTSNGKIDLLLTPGVRNMLSQKSIETIRKLTPADSGRYLWFRAEQVIAYPTIISVVDQDPAHGKRTWVQNHTLLVNIHEFLSHYLTGSGNIFTAHVLPEQKVFPEFFDSINI